LPLTDSLQNKKVMSDLRDYNKFFTTEKKKSDSIGILVSGGVDSCILLAQAIEKYSFVLPIYVKTGLIWEVSELFWLEKFLKTLNVSSLKDPAILDLPVKQFYTSHWSITGQNVPEYNAPDEDCYLPGRNILLLSISAICCIRNNVNVLALGTLKGNPFADASDDFFRLFEQSISIGMETDFSIITPFATMTKMEVLHLGKPYRLELTFSCNSPVDNKHCGGCAKCRERIQAFRKAEIKDKTEYASSLQ